LIVRLGALNSRLKPGRFVAVRGLGAVILDRRKRQRLKMFSTTSTISVEFASNLAMKPNLFFDSNRRLVRCMCQELRHARRKMKRLCRKVSCPAPRCSLWCRFGLSCGLWSQMDCMNVYACRKIMVSASNFFCLS
jgi:hypothetical protein